MIRGGSDGWAPVVVPAPSCYRRGMSDQVLLALIAVIGTVVTSALSAYVLVRTGRIEGKTKETHDLVNGMSHELNLAQVGQAKAEGVAEGEQAQRDREGPPQQ